MEALLTTNEAAELLGVEPTTLIDWRYRNKGPTYIRVSRRFIRYRPADLEKWANRHLVKPGGPK